MFVFVFYSFPDKSLYIYKTLGLKGQLQYMFIFFRDVKKRDLFKILYKIGVFLLSIYQSNITYYDFISRFKILKLYYGFWFLLKRITSNTLKIVVIKWIKLKQ